MAANPDLSGIGSSPYLGDTGGLILVRPLSAGERAGRRRRLYKLTPSIEIAAGETISIVALRLALTIAELFEVEEAGPPADEFTVKTERHVVSPFWSFTDGNVSFHLRVMTGLTSIDFPGPSFTPPSLTADPWNGPPGEVVEFGTATTTLTPGLGGKPPGEIVGALGTMRYISFPFARMGDDSVMIPIDGPASVALYASILQTDPETRPVRPAPGVGEPALAGELPEDDFVRTHQDVTYRGVGGAIVYEKEEYRVCPCCPVREDDDRPTYEPRPDPSVPAAIPAGPAVGRARRRVPA